MCDVRHCLLVDSMATIYIYIQSWNMVNNKLRIVDVIDLYMNELLFTFVDFRNVQGLCNIYNYSCSTATLANHLGHGYFMYYMASYHLQS